MSIFKDKSLKKCHTDCRKMIDDIHEDIIETMEEQELSSYYLDNGVLLDTYYKSATEVAKRGTGILSYLHRHCETEVDDTSNRRKDLIEQYMGNIDDSYVKSETQKNAYELCPSGCSEPMKISHIEGTLQCHACGYTEDIIIESEKGSYNDAPNESNYFAYKRINHFNEWLSQFQAKATTDIPEEIYVNVHKELKKDIYLDWSSLTYAQVRQVLKKLKYNKYYEHIPHLVNVLSGNKAPHLERNVEETLRSLFKDIQKPFLNNCPSTRKNFLSYSYVLHKFCELLEYDDLLICFPLLKSREKLQQQDMIWEKICHDLHWEYIPST